MSFLGSDSGMAQLIVDGQDVGAVYYEINDRRKGIVGILSGDPFALRRAFEERVASLVLENGPEVPIEVTDVLDDEGTASVRVNVNAKMPA